MTNDQLTLNQIEFSNLIQQLRQCNPCVADLLMMNRLKLDRHVEAQEKQIENRRITQ